MWILKMGCSIISSICLGIVNLLVVKCRQDNSKKFALLCFCTFLCLVDLRICVCLNRTRPWLELNIKFNPCSVSLSSKHWWGLITFEFIQILKSLIEYLCLKYLTHPSKWRAEELGVWEVSLFVVPEEIVYVFFSFLFDLLQN